MSGEYVMIPSVTNAGNAVANGKACEHMDEAGDSQSCSAFATVTMHDQTITGTHLVYEAYDQLRKDSQ